MFSRLRAQQRAILKAALLFLAAPLLLYAFSFSPPPARTGGFGEGTCVACHTGTALNGAPGSVAITVPASYSPGTTTAVTVTIQDSSTGRNVWGFELSARFRDGSQAGSFAVAAPVGVQTFSGVQYAGHQPAQFAAGNSFTYTVNWTAPSDASKGDVIFNAAGNAANGDGSSQGDHIFATQAVSLAPSAAVAPKIFSGGVVDGASFVAAPNNIVAPGALISIFGANLASATTGAINLPLPLSLSGTQVMIGNIAAPLIFVSTGQINAQVPFEAAAGGPVNVVVKVAGQPDSAPEPVMVQATAPGIFALAMNGTGPSAILHADFTLVSNTAPARPGETVLVYCTGLGATQPAVQTGAAGNAELTVNMPTVSIGGQNARVDFSGAAPGFAGLYQINTVIPAFTAAGDYDVIISTGGQQSRAGATVRVQP